MAANERVATLTLNRPDALNALNAALLRDLDAAVSRIEDDDDIHVVILTGAGRAFAAGADIGEMLAYNAVEGKKFGAYGNSVFYRLENLNKPVIAAVNGFALGGGCELAMACDIRLASEKAKFGQPEVGLGITPGFGGTQRLPRLIGSPASMELLLTGRVIGAEEALRLGLVNAVYSPDELLAKAAGLAKTIAAQPQVAVRQIKQCVRKGAQVDLSTAIAFEAEAFGVCFSTEDQKDSMAAFLEKRKIDSFKNK
ncbi:MAG: enoyl-CoA hydratase/isomerase family protein [Clostridiales bacterium]|nr:enoyl-CoA hydratase/isomerase family protein [Clostridiales bacterium]